MVEISESYNDKRIVAQLQQLLPELNFGDRAHVIAVDADAGPYNASRFVRLVVEVALSPEEWRQVLDRSREAT